MRFSKVAAVAVLMAASALAGCQSARQALGMTKVVPDEFRVVSKAPLVVPPDYSLRPPAPGEPRPQELEPESQARMALLGQQEGAQRSDGEKDFVAQAGGDHADPRIRYIIDDEFGSVAHKDKSFADRVMFWRKEKPSTQGDTVTAAEAGMSTPAPIDPAVEANRIHNLTANQPVLIERKQDSRIKLPGL